MKLVGRFEDNQDTRLHIAEMVGSSAELRHVAREVVSNVLRILARHHDTGAMRTRIRLERVIGANGRPLDYEIINRDPAAEKLEWGFKHGPKRDKRGRFRKREWVQGHHVMRNAAKNTRRGRA